MCLYNAVRFLGLPLCYKTDVGDGPFSVNHYNENVKRYAEHGDIQNQGMYLRLLGAEAFEAMGLQGPRDFVCYCQSKDSACSVGHFFAARATAESGEVEIMDDSSEMSMIMDITEFRALCRKYATFLFHPDACMPSSSSPADGWSYQVMGGANSDFCQALETSLTSCVDCGRKFRKTERKRASVYGFYPTRDVWHGCRRCSSLKCNARHWFNYRSRSQSKKFFEERKENASCS